MHNLALEVNVSTATAIICRAAQPFKILAGISAKHPLAVLPGGKIESGDLQRDLVEAGQKCIVREVREETNCSFQGPRLVGIATDPSRDIRSVPVAKLKDVLVHPLGKQNESAVLSAASGLITAHYGVPDLIFLGTIQPGCVSESEELQTFLWLDVREVKLGELSAGHDVIALMYRHMLEDGLNRFPEGALSKFDEDRDYLAKRFADLS